MAEWAKAPEGRSQLILFPQRLDQALPAQHTARLLDEILGQLDWSAWEAKYCLRIGQPPIHPRVLAAVLLYGLLTRIRSSRLLEEALQVRLDFRWLAEGRVIDHTTLSEFRRQHHAALKKLFMDVCLLARSLGFLSLQRLGYDGTRVRASNRRSGTRTPEQLRQERDELAAKYEATTALAQTEDTAEEELFDLASPHDLPADCQELPQRLAKLNSVLQELNRAAVAGETVPTRIPTTDLDARLMGNKEGGFAPNYTPTTLVDLDSGFIVGADVLQQVSEAKQMLPAVDQACQQFAPEVLPAIMADGLITTTEHCACVKRIRLRRLSVPNVHSKHNALPARLNRDRWPANRMNGSVPSMRNTWPAPQRRPNMPSACPPVSAPSLRSKSALSYGPFYCVAWSKFAPNGNGPRLPLTFSD